MHGIAEIMTSQIHLPSTLDIYTLQERLDWGWGWELFCAEYKRISDGNNRVCHLRIFYNQSEYGTLQVRFTEALAKLQEHPHLHVQPIPRMLHFVLENGTPLLIVEEERVLPWTSAKPSDHQALCRQLMAAMEHLNKMGLLCAGLSVKNLARARKGGAVLAHLATIWEREWSGRTRPGDTDYFRHLPPESIESPDGSQETRSVWIAGNLLVDAVVGMEDSLTGIKDDTDVFDSPVSGFLHSNPDASRIQALQRIPEDVQRVLRKSLSPRPDDRFTSLAALREALDAPIPITPSDQRYVIANAASVKEVGHPPRRILAHALLAVTLFFATALLVYWLWVLYPASQEMSSLAEQGKGFLLKPDRGLLVGRGEDEQVVEDAPETGLAVSDGLPDAAVAGADEVGGPQTTVEDEGKIEALPEVEEVSPSVADVPAREAEDPNGVTVNLDEASGLLLSGLRYGVRGQEVLEVWDGDVLDLAAGDYTFQFERQDYYPMRKTLRLRPGGQYGVQIPSVDRWVPRPALKQLLAWEERAKTEPLDVLIEMQASDVDEILEAEEARLRKDELLARLRAQLERMEVVVSLPFKSGQDGAPISVEFLNGEDLLEITGSRPVRISPGRYTLVFRRPDYLERRVVLDLEPGGEFRQVVFPEADSWEPEPYLSDLFELDRLMRSRENTRQVIVLLQSLREQVFVWPEHRARYLELRKRWYGGNSSK